MQVGSAERNPALNGHLLGYAVVNPTDGYYGYGCALPTNSIANKITPVIG